jgi:urea transport system ATP-binding protein
MNEGYVLQVEGLSVAFDGFKAVDGLTLYVDKNEIRAVIGPNGAGKTTLLDLISGKTRPTSGKVTFKGAEITGKKEHEIVNTGVGRKFQTPSVYETLTVFENLEMACAGSRTWLSAYLFKRTPAIVERVNEVAKMVYLQDLLEQPAESLSHGQKQWLEIGSLLMQGPQLMLLDEPVAGMSVHERERTAELLQELCKERAVIVVEHDMQFVRRIAHQVTVMHQGRIIAEGKMDVVQNDQKVIDVYLGH